MPNTEAMKIPEVRYYRELSSTMDEARRLAGDGFTGAVVADRQTRGRGRRGRSWLSPEGGLYLTLVVRPSLPGEVLPVLSLGAAAAVAEILREEYGIPVTVKWPNDILFAGRKLGGILLEASFRGNRPEYVLVGLGLNLNLPVSAHQPQAVALREILGRTVPREELLSVLLPRLETYLYLPPERMVSLWKTFAETLGKRVRVILPEGEVVGVAREVSERGGLIVETAEGRQEILWGDCVHLRPAQPQAE
ncbi:biotin--[acetyl-CoA-carboxylase] ligase [Thermosulfurimonas sp. F29]|uniref:biotin--[acetyl-CoA-carboxylase] ligase n=1 Tax=Thermosulfurimonas sp. F29 TaxID=2867247 RepID=UPI001C83202C|nr:biotin--[acetyl-CoA-carboxylase] ligase [Thermosulfurimonas sp. F29]MBX6422367.1 biotin--[acetyl-CoA-carboxylase] ligase [Thermosulfurimonas sp. F29]